MFPVLGEVSGIPVLSSYAIGYSRENVAMICPIIMKSGCWDVSDLS